MRWTIAMAMAAALMGASAQARAADWWWVAGEPGDSAATFVDAETVVRTGDSVSFHAQRIGRDGSAREEVRRLRCDKPAPADGEAARRFACASDEERMRSALMIHPMTPRQTARLILAMPKPGANRDDMRMAAR